MEIDVMVGCKELKRVTRSADKKLIANTFEGFEFQGVQNRDEQIDRTDQMLCQDLNSSKE